MSRAGKDILRSCSFPDSLRRRCTGKTGQDFLEAVAFGRWHSIFRVSAARVRLRGPILSEGWRMRRPGSSRRATWGGSRW